MRNPDDPRSLPFDHRLTVLAAALPHAIAQGWSTELFRGCDGTELLVVLGADDPGHPAYLVTTEADCLVVETVRETIEGRTTVADVSSVLDVLTTRIGPGPCRDLHAA